MSLWSHFFVYINILIYDINVMNWNKNKLRAFLNNFKSDFSFKKKDWLY